MMCPFTDKALYMACFFGVKAFMIMWVILVPLIVIARLNKIIKLLEKKEG
ncbi:MAG: hypothetical protein P9X22_03255 [Candidatus Zapsychrus exili]|nr:hypothetical protein [Candidatus Zapsychrus exili]